MTQIFGQSRVCGCQRGECSRIEVGMSHFFINLPHIVVLATEVSFITETQVAPLARIYFVSVYGNGFDVVFSGSSFCERFHKQVGVASDSRTS